MQKQHVCLLNIFLFWMDSASNGKINPKCISKGHSSVRRKRQCRRRGGGRGGLSLMLPFNIATLTKQFSGCEPSRKYLNNCRENTRAPSWTPGGACILVLSSPPPSLGKHLPNVTIFTADEIFFRLTFYNVIGARSIKENDLFCSPCSPDFILSRFLWVRSSFRFKYLDHVILDD